MSAIFNEKIEIRTGFDSKTVQRSALCRSRRELSNGYLLAKFGFDTAFSLTYCRGQPCRVRGGAHRPREAPRCNFNAPAVLCQILL